MRFNERIRVSPVRLISDSGEQLGVVPVEEALTRAREAGLDLVEVAPTADPPVCRLMDYGRFKYRQRKRDQQALHRHAGELKSVQLGGPRIEDHDLEFKLRKARQFLERGQRVQIYVRFRRAQMRHSELGLQVLERCAEMLSDIANVEQMPKLDGRRMAMSLTQKPGKRSRSGRRSPAGEQAGEARAEEEQPGQVQAEEVQTEEAQGGEVRPNEEQAGQAEVTG